MADEILIVFKADTGDLDKVVGKIEQLTKLQEELKAQVSSTYAGKQLDEAINKLNKQAETMEKLTAEYSAASAATKVYEDALEKLKEKSEENTKSAGALKKALKENEVQAIASAKAIEDAGKKDKLFEPLIKGLQGMKSALSSVSKTAELFGGKTEELDKVIKKVGNSIEVLEDIQKTYTAVTEKNGIAARAYGAALEVVDFIQKELVVSSAAAWAAITGGIAVLVAGIGALIYWLSSAEETTVELTKSQKDNIFATQQLELAYKKATGAIDEYTAKTKALAIETSKSMSEIQDKMNKEIEASNSSLYVQFLQVMGFYITATNKTTKDRLEIEKKYGIDLEELKKQQAIKQAILDEEEQRRLRHQKLTDIKATLDAQLILTGEYSDKHLALAIKEAIAERNILLDNDKLTAAERELIYTESLDKISKLRIADAEKAAKLEYDLEVARLKRTIATTRTRDENNLKAKLALIDLEAGAKIAASTKGVKKEQDILDLSYEAYQKSLKDKANATRDYYKEIDRIEAEFNKEPYIASEDPEVIKKEQADSLRFELELYEQSKQRRLEADKEYAAARIQLEQETVTAVQNLYESLTGFISSIYDNQLQSLEQQKEKELAAVGDNAAAKTKVEQKYAMESAKIKRKQAIMEKVFASIQVAITLAQAIQKITAEAAVLSTNIATMGLAGLAYAQIPIVVASSAIQLAAINAKPLPEIPQFEKGGPVGNKLLHGRSHRQGGILINAQGGEYIWDIPTVKKHGDIIRAAHENRLEDLMMHKYIVPAMQRTLPATKTDTAALYDDFMLRAAIKQSSEKADKNAKYIADRVSNAVASSMFNKNRYN